MDPLAADAAKRLRAASFAPSCLVFFPKQDARLLKEKQKAKSHEKTK
jgi:hypothetical protein